MTVTVIIPAAGLGTRMARSAAPASNSGDESSGTSRKQLMLLGDSPILIHTIRKFAACPLVTQIVVALRPQDATWVSVLIKREGFATPVHIVEGGDSRQESVRNALNALGSTADLVAVHDAVRPFVEPSIIENVIQEAARSGAAIAGIVPIDTVKQVKGHKIRETLMRDHLILAQTPQIFRYELLKRAFDTAAAENFTGTDESSLVERLGHEVTVVPGSDRNIKITRPGDMDLAKLFLAEELAAQSA